MSRTTDQWQKLLEGATPGPWVWIDEPDDADTQYIVDWGTGGMCLSLDAIGSGSAYKPSDPVLAAVAPEAVAEVVRLRRELEGLKRTVGSLTLSAELLAGDHPIHRGALNGAANEFRELHDTIANILNQEDTDE